jgi:hypothetical protein
MALLNMERPSFTEFGVIYFREFFCVIYFREYLNQSFLTNFLDML